MNELFLDSSYALALASTADATHAIASALADQLTLRKLRMVTTTAVLMEIGNSLARQRYRVLGA